jgi:4-hydroxy-L-threonine phosphate dehydrogenase PdxA
MDKLNFIKTEFPKLLQNLDPEAKGVWGVMNGQQMIEHITDSVSQATGKNNQTLHTAPELVERYKSFALSDKEFKPNTPNVLMSDTPAPIAKATMKDAIADYNDQMSAFINYFENNKGAILINPFFGDFNFEEWTHLLYKHAIHHSKQFGLL